MFTGKHFYRQPVLLARGSLFRTHSESILNPPRFHSELIQKSCILGSPMHPVVYLCACRRRFFSLKKLPWEFGACILWMCSMFIDFRAPAQKIDIWSICSNDYASKTRIEILRKNMCWIAPHRFSQLHFLGNSWDDRTLATPQPGGAPARARVLKYSQGPALPLDFEIHACSHSG